MPTIPVAIAGRPYEVRVGHGLIADLAAQAGARLRKPVVPVITDAHVHAAWGPRVEASLAGAGKQAAWKIFPAGEATKSWASLVELVDWLLALEVERGDHIIALGGGVIGDLTGFAAAILKRGCHFIQLPTTLLAQVDSSVGGKTAINTPAGKNLVGAFHQPALVLADLDALATLPARELAAGYAEVFKYGLIDDAGFFAWCEAHGPALLAGDVARANMPWRIRWRPRRASWPRTSLKPPGARAAQPWPHLWPCAGSRNRLFRPPAARRGGGAGHGAGGALLSPARADGRADAARITAHTAAVGLPADARAGAERFRRAACRPHAARQEGGRRPPRLPADARHRPDLPHQGRDAGRGFRFLAEELGGCRRRSLPPQQGLEISPVKLAGLAATCSGVPSATICRRRMPPSGPMSMIQSAVLITSRLCSITTTELP
jgi:3-dehydroquinate synthase